MFKFPRLFLASVLALGFLIPVALFAEQAAKAPEVEILNAKQPLPNVLSGGQPTPDQLAEAAAAGYKTVISLRRDGEIDWDEKGKVEELGMQFIHMPIGSEDLDAEHAAALAEALAKEEDQPILLHCGSGNRIGALIALNAYHHEGKDLEAALEAGREAGMTRLEEKITELLKAAPKP